MIIVDSHAHLGSCRIFCVDYKSEDLIRRMDQYNIQISIVQPHPGTDDPVSAHEAVAEMAVKYPGRIYGMACFNPLLDEDDFVRKVTWAIKDLKFKAVKLHTNGYCVSPVHPGAKKLFKTANDLNIPVMIHTGAGVPNALPSLCIQPAMEYPNLPIILAHAGAGIFTPEAVIAAKVCKNIYLETSWVNSLDTVPMVESVGADRVMMGTDVPENVSAEIHKYMTAGLTEDQLDYCLGKTAINVFKI